MVGTTVYMAPEVMNATDSVILSTTSPDDLVLKTISFVVRVCTVYFTIFAMRMGMCRSRL